MDFETKFYSAGVPLAATVHIPDREKENLSGRNIVHGADGGARAIRQYPTVILCHGNARHRNDGLDVLAQRLGDSGIASLRFDFRGCGAGAARKYHLLMSSEMPYDVQCAIDYCESLPFVDRSRIGMTGISMGGMMTIRTVGGGERRIKSAAPMSARAVNARSRMQQLGAEKYKECEEMIMEDARVNAATGISRIVNRISFMGGQDESAAAANLLEGLMFPADNAYCSLESIRDANRFDTLQYAAQVECPIFIIHGEADELVDPRDAREIFDAIPDTNPNKRLKFYPGVDHNIPISEKRETVFQDIVEWFLETL